MLFLEDWTGREVTLIFVVGVTEERGILWAVDTDYIYLMQNGSRSAFLKSTIKQIKLMEEVCEQKG
jgi:hypothetical protein